MSRNGRARRTERATAASPIRNDILGADFGVPPRIMVVGGTDFIQHFPHIDALGYAEGDKDLALTLVFDTREHARAALESIRSWLPRDPDDLNGFRLWIVLKENQAEYALIIHRSSEQTEKSLLGTRLDPHLMQVLSTQVGHRKTFPVSGPHVERFRHALGSGAPVSVAFADQRGAYVGVDIPVRLRMLTEGELQQEIAAAADIDLMLVEILFRGADTEPSDPPDELPTPTPSEVTSRRTLVMEGWFPCTLAICRSGSVGAVTALRSCEEYEEWQVLQAACYLVAAAAAGHRLAAGDLAGFLHTYREIPANMEHLRGTLGSLSRRSLVNQIRLNSLYLLRAVKQQPTSQRGQDVQATVRQWVHA